MHWLDILILALLVLAAVQGYRDGVIRQALALLSWLISIALANRVVPYLAQYFDFLGEVQNVAWASWLVGFILCMVVCNFASGVLIGILRFPFGVLDHLLGMVLGVLVAVLILGFVVNLYAWLSTFLPLPPIPEDVRSVSLLQQVMKTFMNEYLFELMEGDGATSLQTA